MALKTLGEYTFESRSDIKNYGDDMIVHVWAKNSTWFCSSMAVRIPQNMVWKDFVSEIAMPYVNADPDFDKDATVTWELVGEAFEPADDKTLSELGVQHKNTISLVA